MSKPVSLKPIFSEKAFQSSRSGLYMFEVPRNVGKLDVATAVQTHFKVEVSGVRCANISGKVRKSWRKRSGWQVGQRPDRKRAYVQLKAGHSLPFFEEEHEHDNAKSTAKTKKAEAK